MDFKKKSIYCFALFIAGIFLISSIVSAGFFDKFFSPSAEKNVSVNVVGVDPVVVTIHNETLTGLIPNEANINNGQLDVTFNVNVYDPNGVGDIVPSSVKANFTFSSYAGVREDLSCTDLNQNTANSKNFSCTITLFYFDPYGSWLITSSAVDSGNGVPQEDMKRFNLGVREGIEISPSSGLLFNPLIPGSVNINATNDPTVVNNTGNANSSLQIRGLDLLSDGPQDTSFGVGNFSADDTLDQECVSGSALLNGTYVDISVPLARGDLSLGQGQTNIYYCVKTVPANLPAQAYSTTRGGPWTIRPT